MSITQLTLLTTLNMLGSGIIMLPAKIGSIGAIALTSWILVSAGAVAMAYAFAFCGMYSRHDGGLGSIAENAFGGVGCFMTNASYALSLLVANAAIATTASAYLSSVLGLHANPVVTQLITVILLWCATLVNLPGAKFTGRLSALTVWGIFFPMLFLLCAAPFYFDPHLFEANWNPHGLGDFASLQAAVPKAVLIATTLAAVMFIAASTVICGIIPNDEIISASAPFFVVFTRLFGSFWAQLLSLVVFLAMWGSLMGWQFTMARVFKISAEQGYFPAIFKNGVYFGVPVVGLLLLALCQTFLVMAMPAGNEFNRFDVLVDMSVILNVFPYLTCMAAVFVVAKMAPCSVGRSLAAQFCAGVSLIFLVGYFFFTPSEVMKFSLIMILLGFVCYGVLVVKSPVQK